MAQLYSKLHNFIILIAYKMNYIRLSAKYFVCFKLTERERKTRVLGKTEQLFRKGKIFSVFMGKNAGRGSSIGSVSAWHASGPEFDPHVPHIL